MQITHQADYAIRTVLYLSRLEPNRRVPTSEIAKFNRIPPSFLTKIVSQLSIAGLIHTSRGARGGVWLARPPEEISVLEVLQAIDGNLLLNQCVADPENCSVSQNCGIYRFWMETCRDVLGRLREATFDQFISEKEQPIPA
ncbi:MAG: Rrf2 family transcriptional regulator [Anaerolineaceae bacterium]|nr:Rrf2 family transcriptional regulator [Anaerolineaceae bacterium]